jgi:hypothetical protein
MKESELTNPKAAKTTFSQTGKNKAQPTDSHRTNGRTIKERCVGPRLLLQTQKLGSNAQGVLQSTRAWEEIIMNSNAGKRAQ